MPLAPLAIPETIEQDEIKQDEIKQDVLDQDIIERYEMKYRIPTAMQVPLRQALSRYCDPDPTSPDGRYLITSLYLDSPDRQLYRETMEACPRRFKLRIRRYVTGPVFLEIKRRLKDVIVKSRVAVSQQDWPGVLLDPATAHRQKLKPTAAEALNVFTNRWLRLFAEPAALVRYVREAYVSRIDHYARVTFDHRLEGRRPDGYRIPIADGPGWFPVDRASRLGLPESGVILELKCTTAVPTWMTDLVRAFGLTRQGFSKYASALEVADRFPRDLGNDRQPSRWARRRRA